MRALYCSVVSASLLLAVGCSTLGMANTENKLIGKYKVDMKLSEEDKKNPMSGFAQGMANMFSLELKKDHTFAMSMIFPIEGTWSYASDKVTLKPTKFMGMSASDVSKMAPQNDPNAQKQASEMSKPMILDVQSDGSLKMQDQTGKSKSDMVFKKDTSS